MESRLDSRTMGAIARLQGLAAAAVLLALTACVSGRPVERGTEARLRPQRPLIFVPGILGSKLVHEDSGKYAWGGGFDVFFPRDYAYELALPIPTEGREVSVGQEGADGREGRETREGRVSRPGFDLRPTTVVDEVRLAFYRRKVYGQLADYFEGRGYQLGSLDDPQPDDSFFMFSYDYRRSNLETVSRLRTALDHLRRVRGGGDLEFDLLCQSNGGYVCRYLMRYGAEFDPVFGGEGAILKKGAPGPPRGLVPRRLGLAGTANAGGLRILHEFRDGRYFVKRMGRHFSPEILFAMRPLFDDLPWPSREKGTPSGKNGADIFIDENGEPMAVDLYSAADWVNYDLSVFAPRVERRLQRPRGRALFGDSEDRERYLGERLRASRELQMKLLAVDSAEQDVELLMVQGRELSTPRRAVLRKTEDGWQTIFAGDKAAGTLSQSVRDLLVEQGDGHATLASQETLSPSEVQWLVGKTVFASGSHFKLILDPVALQALGDFFLSRTPAAWGQQ